MVLPSCPVVRSYDSIPANVIGWDGTVWAGYSQPSPPSSSAVTATGAASRVRCWSHPTPAPPRIATPKAAEGKKRQGDWR